MPGAWQGTRCEFFCAAHVQHIGGALAVVQPALRLCSGQCGHTGLCGLKGGQRAFCFPGRDRTTGAACAAVLQAKARQRPALCAIFQCDDRVWNAKAAQDLCPDDASRAARTVNDDGRGGIRRQCVPACCQFPVGH